MLVSYLPFPNLKLLAPTRGPLVAAGFKKKKGRTPKDVKDLGNARLVPPEYKNWIGSNQWSMVNNLYDIYINEEQVHGQIRQIDPATVLKNANSTVAKPLCAPAKMVLWPDADGKLWCISRQHTYEAIQVIHNEDILPHMDPSTMPWMHQAECVIHPTDGPDGHRRDGAG